MKPQSQHCRHFYQGVRWKTAVSHPDSGEIFFETYTIHPEENVSAAPETSTAQFGDAILLTYTDVALIDDAIHITTTWQGKQQPAADHTIFIHLYEQGNESGAPVAQLDVQPCYPTSHWHADEAIRETYRLTLPPDLPPGDYTLGLGWYTWPSFERLPLVKSESPLSDQRHRLEQITIDD